MPIKEVPDHIPPPHYANPRLDHPIIVAVTLDKGIETETGQVFDDCRRFLNFIMHRRVYTATVFRGLWERAILRLFPPDVARQLATNHSCVFDHYLIRYHGNNESLELSVQRGHYAGALINLPQSAAPGSDPASIHKTVDHLLKRLNAHSERSVPLTTIGGTAEDYVLNNVHSTWRKFDHSILSAFCYSFVGGRFEVPWLGAGEVYDYDTTAAYGVAVQQLVSTDYMVWKRGKPTMPLDEIDYLAGIVNVQISTKLPIGPVPYFDGGLVGSKKTFYPVGLIEGARISLPTLRFLERNPSFGRVTKWLGATWGYSAVHRTYPFRQVVSNLLNMRETFGPGRATFAKAILNAIWGKMVAAYRTPNGVKCGPLFNPIYGAHLNDAVRIGLLEQALGTNFNGMWVDGFACEEDLGVGDRSKPGHLRLVNNGYHVNFNDIVKANGSQNQWLLEWAKQNKDATRVEFPAKDSYLTAADALQQFRNGDDFYERIGEPYTFITRHRLGSFNREYPEGLRVGDMLEGPVETSPVRFEDIAAYTFDHKVFSDRSDAEGERVILRRGEAALANFQTASRSSSIGNGPSSPSGELRTATGQTQESSARSPERHTTLHSWLALARSSRAKSWILRNRSTKPPSSTILTSCRISNFRTCRPQVIAATYAIIRAGPSRTPT